jgi:hypothetical protein
MKKKFSVSDIILMLLPVVFLVAVGLFLNSAPRARSSGAASSLRYLSDLAGLLIALGIISVPGFLFWFLQRMLDSVTPPFETPAKKEDFYRKDEGH